MDRMQLVYAILQLKFPGGYRNAKGAKYMASLNGKSLEQLTTLYKALGGK